MSDVLLVLICSIVGGLVSMIGGIILSAKKRNRKVLEYATSFAAGALLAAAFIDLLPEALEHSHDDITIISIFILIGILIFFLIENLIHWFHSHSHRDDKPNDSIVPLIIIGDTIHNIVDGIAIAAGFLVDPMTGIITTLAVAAHEIPQEVGDFGLLLSKGLPRKRVILVNLLSSLATVISTIIFFLIGNSIHIKTAPILAIIAGFFIYIAMSDIIPSIRKENNRKQAIIKSIILLGGIIIVGLCVFLLHGFIK